MIKGNQIEIQYLRMCDDEIELDFVEITQCLVFSVPSSDVEIQQRISKENYLSKVSKMLEHIHRGDIYEANFCMEFYAEKAVIEPLEIYQN